MGDEACDACAFWGNKDAMSRSSLAIAFLAFGLLAGAAMAPGSPSYPLSRFGRSGVV